MKPALSVILLTVLIGTGQGLFVSLIIAEQLDWVAIENTNFFVRGSALALLLLAAGLVASFFHLGRPERAWRAATMWRTSWLSREVIALPTAMLTILVFGAAHWFGFTALNQSPLSAWAGFVGVVAMLVLFICTGMIYACVKFLQEWATPLTVVNFTLLGLSSGFVLGTVFCVSYAPYATVQFSSTSLALISTAFIFKLCIVWRNRNIKPKSTTQTALGIRHTKINQQSVGFSSGSFNTREFFHGKSSGCVDLVARLSLLLTFVAPGLLIPAGLFFQWPSISNLVLFTMTAGLLLERWHFFAQAQHPQNLYYQSDR